MDQTSVSSVYLNLDALTSSSNEESQDVKKCEDLAVTIVCKSEEVVTRVNSKEVLSDEDLPAVFGARDIRQVIRRRDMPPDGPTRRTARSDSQQEPSAPAVDLVTGKCKPGKVSRTVFTSALTLDMTVMCTPEPEILQPRAATQGALPADTVNNTVAGFDALCFYSGKTWHFANSMTITYIHNNTLILLLLQVCTHPYLYYTYIQ